VFTSTSWWLSANGALRSIGKQLQPVDDLVGHIWLSNERPKESQQPIVRHEVQYAGEDVAQKLSRTTTELRRVGATTAVISALDEIAWQFNLRGADIPSNPFFKAYAIIHANYTVNQPELFVNLAQLDSTKYPPGVRVFNYSMFWSRLNATATNTTTKKVWVSARAAQAILGSIPDRILLLPLSNSPVQRVKARKNSVERKGMQDCQIRDAVVRMKHLGWIEQQLNNGVFVNETQSVDQLIIYQKQQNKFQFPSFTAISASGDRAAVIHYSPEPATARRITKDHIYLLDVSVTI
jgi:Xaa-Pro aminopeptidase